MITAANFLQLYRELTSSTSSMSSRTMKVRLTDFNAVLRVVLAVCNVCRFLCAYQLFFLHLCRMPVNISGYLDYTDSISVDELFQSADDKLLEKIIHNSAHVLQPLIPDSPPSSYDLRPSTHDKLLLNKTSYLNNREFVICMLYRDSYWLLYMSMNYVLIFFFILCYLLFIFVRSWMNEWAPLFYYGNWNL